MIVIMLFLFFVFFVLSLYLFPLRLLHNNAFQCNSITATREFESLSLYCIAVAKWYTLVYVRNARPTPTYIHSHFGRMQKSYNMSHIQMHTIRRAKRCASQHRRRPMDGNDHFDYYRIKLCTNRWPFNYSDMEKQHTRRLKNLWIESHQLKKRKKK